MGVFSLLLCCFSHPVMSGSSVLSVLVIVRGRDCSDRRVSEVPSLESLHVGCFLLIAA